MTLPPCASAICFDDRQPESAAANAIGAAPAVERLEQMRQIARGDARTAVFDRKSRRCDPSAAARIATHFPAAP